MSGPLQKQLMTIPLAGGVDAKSDPLTVDSGHFLTVENGRYTDAGAIRKRPGNGQQGTSLSTTAAAAICSLDGSVGAVSAAAASVFQASGDWRTVRSARVGTITGEPVLSQGDITGATPGPTSIYRTDVVGIHPSIGNHSLRMMTTASSGTLYQVLDESGGLIAQSSITGGGKLAAGANKYVVFTTTTTSNNVREIDPISGTVTLYSAVLPSSITVMDAIPYTTTKVLYGFYDSGTTSFFVSVYDTTTHAFSTGAGRIFIPGFTPTTAQLSLIGNVCGILLHSSSTGTALVGAVNVTVAGGTGTISSTFNASDGVTFAADPTSTTAPAWHVWSLHATTTSYTLAANRYTCASTVPGAFSSSAIFSRLIDNKAVGHATSTMYQCYFPWRAQWTTETSTSRAWVAFYNVDLPRLVRFDSSNVLTGSALPGLLMPLATFPVASHTPGAWRSHGTQTTALLATAGNLEFTNFTYTLLPITQTACIYRIITEDMEPAVAPPLVGDGVLAYSGDGLPEVISPTGVHEQGFMFSGPPKGTGISATAGTLTVNQNYTYFVMYETVNARGEVERSAVYPLGTVYNSGTSGWGAVVYFAPPITNRQSYYVAIYRTCYISGVMSTQAYRISTTGLQTSAGGSTFNDTIPDATGALGDPLYTQAELAENSAPPLSSLVRWRDRLVGVDSTDGQTLWMTKPQEGGVALSWAADNCITMPPGQGAVVGVAPMDDKLIIFQESAVSYISGPGPDAAGDGSFAGPFFISAASGCTNAQSVLVAGDGVWYQGSRGLWFIDRGLGNTYRGVGVESLVLADTITATCQATDYSQLFWFMASGTALVYDTLVQRWSTYTNYATDAAMMHNGRLLRMRTGTMVQDDDSYLDGGTTPYTMTVKTAWLKPVAGPQGFQRIYRAGVLGRYLGPHVLNLAVAYDYDETNAHTASWMPYDPASSPFNPTALKPYQVRWRLPKQKCEAIQLTLATSTQYTIGTDPPQTNNVADACALSSLVLEFGVLPGLYRLPQANSV
jgi:hypothetical protein